MSPHQGMRRAKTSAESGVSSWCRRAPAPTRLARARSSSTRGSVTSMSCRPKMPPSPAWGLSAVIAMRGRAIPRRRSASAVRSITRAMRSRVARHLLERAMGRDVGHAKVAVRQHHGAVAHAREHGQHLGVARVAVADKVQRLLVEGARHQRGHAALHGETRGGGHGAVGLVARLGRQLPRPEGGACAAGGQDRSMRPSSASATAGGSGRSSRCAAAARVAGSPRSGARARAAAGPAPGTPRP